MIQLLSEGSNLIDFHTSNKEPQAGAPRRGAGVGAGEDPRVRAEETQRYLGVQEAKQGPQRGRGGNPRRPEPVAAGERAAVIPGGRCDGDGGHGCSGARAGHSRCHACGQHGPAGVVG